MTTNSSRAIKELLEVIKHKVGRIDTRQGIQSIEIRSLKDQLSVMNEKLDNLKGDIKELTENVDAARGDIENLHMDVKGIRDKEGLFHSRNKREIDEIKTHS